MTTSLPDTPTVVSAFAHDGVPADIPLVLYGVHETRETPEPREPRRTDGQRRAAGGAPVIVYFHGGLFNSGTPGDAEPIARALCGQAIVAVVDYPLAPACRFPDTVEIAYDALRWAWTSAARLGGSAARVFVAGDQAGGNLAAAAAMVARDRQFVTRGARPLAGQILIRPLLDPSQATASMRASAECPCRSGWSDYLPRVGDAEHPYAAPLQSCRLGGLAPALIVTADGDPCRDEATAYVARLNAAGVSAALRQSGSASVDPADPAHPGFTDLVTAILKFVAASAAPPSRRAR